MKKLFSVLFSILVVTSLYANDEKIVSSKIQKVTVYSQGAQIYRNASYSIGKGLTQVVIEGISPRIDANSLQVKATGNVIILDSKYSLFYPQPEATDLDGLPLKIRKAITLLEDSIKTMNYEIQEVQDEMDVYTATKNILSNNGAMRGQGKVNDSIQLLKEALDYYIQSLDIKKEIDFKHGIAISLFNIANTHMKLNNTSDAIENYNASLELANELNENELITRNYRALYKAYLSINDCKNALNYSELYNKSLYITQITDDDKDQISEYRIK